MTLPDVEEGERYHIARGTRRYRSATPTTDGDYEYYPDGEEWETNDKDFTVVDITDHGDTDELIVEEPVGTVVTLEADDGETLTFQLERFNELRHKQDPDIHRGDVLEHEIQVCLFDPDEEVSDESPLADLVDEDSEYETFEYDG